jgi:hypothetical protein
MTTATEVGTVNLLDYLTESRKLPKGCDTWAVRSVHPDGRSTYDFRWPFKGKVAAPGPLILTNKDGCPAAVGDGICLAHTWGGMASGGIPAITLLLVAYAQADVLGRTPGEGKVRVSCAVVVDVVDGQRLLKEHGTSADLRSADLRWANLSSANLRSADLSSANLRWADLSSADLYSADLRLADLSSADLYSANLSSADLTLADLTLADLSSADLYSARISPTTVFPAGFDAVAAGCVMLP